MIRLLQAGGFYAMVSLVENKADIAKTLRAWNVRGAVFLGMFDDEIEQIYAASKAPMVFVDSYSNMRRICSVGIDDYRGGRLAGPLPGRAWSYPACLCRTCAARHRCYPATPCRIYG